MTSEEREILKRLSDIALAHADQMKKLISITSGLADLLEDSALHISVLEAEVAALKEIV